MQCNYNKGNQTNKLTKKTITPYFDSNIKKILNSIFNIRRRMKQKTPTKKKRISYIISYKTDIFLWIEQNQNIKNSVEVHRELVKLNKFLIVNVIFFLIIQIMIREGLGKR